MCVCVSVCAYVAAVTGKSRGALGSLASGVNAVLSC